MGEPHGALYARIASGLHASTSGEKALSCTLDPSVRPIVGCIERQQRSDREGRLCRIEFTTLFEYLQYLRAIAEAVATLGPSAMFYLAAAVSDFYIPWSRLAEHKIQSDDGPLTLHLEKAGREPA